MLAGLVRAPSQLAPTRNFGGAKERADMVLQTMVETGRSPRSGRRRRAQPVKLRTPPETPPGTNYFVDMVAGDVRRFSPTPRRPDPAHHPRPRLQRLAEGVIARRLDAEGAQKNVSQAALVALSQDGAILAMVGGRDYEASQFNRATQAKRQAGSLFKLFVYLRRYEKGYTPQTIVVDRPTQIGDWEPQNANGRFRGAVPPSERLRAVDQHHRGANRRRGRHPAVIETAKRLGVQSDLPACRAWRSAPPR